MEGTRTEYCLKVRGQKTAWEGHDHHRQNEHQTWESRRSGYVCWKIRYGTSSARGRTAFGSEQEMIVLGGDLASRSWHWIVSRGPWWRKSELSFLQQREAQEL